MKELKNKKVIVRLTETQLNQLIQNVEDEKSTISEIIRELLKNKLNNIQIDDHRRRKFRL